MVCSLVVLAWMCGVVTVARRTFFVGGVRILDLFLFCCCSLLFWSIDTLHMTVRSVLMKNTHLGVVIVGQHLR